MIVGFVGLGNVGSKLASTLIRNKIKTFVYDTNPKALEPAVKAGGILSKELSTIAQKCNIIVTCLPSPEICANVIEGQNGLLANARGDQIWVEMSTNKSAEVIRLANRLKDKRIMSADCPVSGGCHRADTGNISIFSGCDRVVFEKIKDILFIMGKKVLHTGPLGTASQLKVMTNFLATTNLVACCEALVTMKATNIDLATTYEAIKISSGNSFVHETESQVILNGSRDINFTLDLVLKDISLFQELANSHNIPLDISPLLNQFFTNAIDKLGARANSPSIISLLEDSTGLSIRAPGFPAQIKDSEPETPGYEIISKISN